MRTLKNIILDVFCGAAMMGVLIIVFFYHPEAKAEGYTVPDASFQIDHREGVSPAFPYTLRTQLLNEMSNVLEKISKPETTCRSQSVKYKFDLEHGYKGSRPQLEGEEPWRVDHVCALECGGKDETSNMAYQQYGESKEKDKWERTPEGCAKTCTPLNSTPTRQVFNCKPKKKVKTLRKSQITEDDDDD